AEGEEARQQPTGRIRLTAGDRTLSEVPVERTAERTYRGKWTPGALSETVLARLIFGSGARAVESTPAAVHFHALLAYAIPSRRTAEIRRLLDGIQAGTEAWAGGLERVCEIVFRLETLEARKAVKTHKAKVKDEAHR